MRSTNKSRSRNKNNRNRNNNIGNIVNRVFDSSGPDGRVRGTPNQIVEKYDTLARDAQLAGDRVEAENFLQHAEHYIRLLAAAQEEVAREQAKRQAEYEARMAEKASRQSEDDELEVTETEEVEVTVDEVEAEEDEKPKRKPGRKKKQEKAPESFDEDTAPDFLKVIND